MGSVLRGNLAALAAVVALLAPMSRVSAEAVRCVADCNGDGTVLINELIAAVNSALGSDPSACPSADANGDGAVTIDELVRAVSDALYGCGVTPPTPPPTRTPTATWTPSPSPSPSPSPTSGVDVSGRWRSDQARLQSTTCPKAFNDAVRASIRAGNFNCDYDVAQRGAQADVTETCKGESFSFTAAVSPDGTLSYGEQESDSADGCLFTVTTLVVAPLAQSPTSITGTYDIDFEAQCGIADCRLVVSGRFRRIP